MTFTERCIKYQKRYLSRLYAPLTWLVLKICLRSDIQHREKAARTADRAAQLLLREVCVVYRFPKDKRQQPRGEETLSQMTSVVCRCHFKSGDCHSAQAPAWCSSQGKRKTCTHNIYMGLKLICVAQLSLKICRPASVWVAFPHTKQWALFIGV